MNIDLCVKSSAVYVTNAMDQQALSAVVPTVRLVHDKIIPAAMKRRMPAMSRLVLGAVSDFTYCQSHQYAIFSSRHGELEQRWHCVGATQQGLMLSPAVFSQSVHNTPAGLLSILFSWQAPSLSIAHEQHLSAALVQAWCYLQQHKEHRVLVVVYEPQLPAFLQQRLNNELPSMAQVFSVSLDSPNLRLSTAEGFDKNTNNNFYHNEIVFYNNMQPELGLIQFDSDQPEAWAWQLLTLEEPKDDTSR